MAAKKVSKKVVTSTKADVTVTEKAEMTMPKWHETATVGNVENEERLDPKEEKMLDWILNGVVIFILGWLGLSVLLVIGGYFGLWK